MAVTGSMPTYDNPPVKEVACEFRFEPGERWNVTIFGLLYEKVKDQFPLRKDAKAMETTIHGAESHVMQEVAPVDRIQFVRNDEAALIQVSPNVLAVSHLRPYPGWARFEEMLFQVFDAYRATAEPKGLARVGLRYVNQFVFPAGEIDPADYFEFYPFVGPTLPQTYSGMIAGIHLPYDDQRDVLRLFMRDVPGASPEGSVQVILDMDYFLNRPGVLELNQIRGWLSAAHGRISKVFEGAIKESVRALLQPR